MVDNGGRRSGDGCGGGMEEVVGSGETSSGSQAEYGSSCVGVSLAAGMRGLLPLPCGENENQIGKKQVADELQR